MESNDFQHIAVLIDAENASSRKITDIIRELSARGVITIKRAYGDWSKASLAKWANELNSNAVQPIQQFSYTTGKNAADIALVIDCMDLLYSKQVTTFVLVSSDSDFTGLAIRLSQANKKVIGIGEKKTPIAFRNACNEFIFVENLGKDTPSAIHKEKQDISELLPLFYAAIKEYQNDDGWVNIASLGSYLKRVKPDYDPLNYGCSKLTEIIASFPQFEIDREPNGRIIVTYFRNKSSDASLKVEQNYS